MHVSVVGAGIVGAACARVLASAGFDVIVLERCAVAGGTSSSCEVNVLVSDKSPGPELDLAMLASTRWRQAAAELKVQLGPVGVICIAWLMISSTPRITTAVVKASAWNSKPCVAPAA